MSRRALSGYEMDELQVSGGAGGRWPRVGPFWLVELGRLTVGCGASCSHDGLHYNNVTYDAAVQLMLHGVRQLRTCED